MFINSKELVYLTSQKIVLYNTFDNTAKEVELNMNVDKTYSQVDRLYKLGDNIVGIIYSEETNLIIQWHLKTFELLIFPLDSPAEHAITFNDNSLIYLSDCKSTLFKWDCDTHQESTFLDMSVENGNIAIEGLFKNE